MQPTSSEITLFQRLSQDPAFNGGFFGKFSHKILSCSIIGVFVGSVFFNLGQAEQQTQHIIHSLYIGTLSAIIWFVLFHVHSLAVKKDFIKVLHLKGLSGVNAELVQTIKASALPEKKKLKFERLIDQENNGSRAMKNREFHSIVQHLKAS